MDYRKALSKLFLLIQMASGWLLSRRERKQRTISNTVQFKRNWQVSVNRKFISSHFTYIFHLFDLRHGHTLMPRFVISEFLHTWEPQCKSGLKPVTVNDFCCLYLSTIWIKQGKKKNKIQSKA